MTSLNLLLAGAIGIMGLVATGQYVEKTKRAKEIAEHRFHLGMPAADVKQSLGEPLLIEPNERNWERWFYPTVVIQFAGGKVIDSMKVPKSNETDPGRTISYLPGHGYIEHQSNVSAMHSIGGGYYAPPPSPTPSFVHGMQGTSLDQKAHR